MFEIVLFSFVLDKIEILLFLKILFMFFQELSTELKYIFSLKNGSVCHSYLGGFRKYMGISIYKKHQNFQLLKDLII